MTRPRGFSDPTTQEFTHLQRQVIDDLAAIEQADADACANCGGEDCVCCPIWLDRQRWVPANELFAEDEPIW